MHARFFDAYRPSRDAEFNQQAVNRKYKSRRTHKEGCILHFAESSISGMLGYRNCRVGGWFLLRIGKMAMDSELKRKVSGVALDLARQEHRRLRAAGTFIELEELACEIGDELTRQLLSLELEERGVEVQKGPSQPCPTCDCPCSEATLRERQLLSTRGEIEYDEPVYHCHFCRRSFFPGGRLDGPAGPFDGNPNHDGAHGLGWQ